MDYGKYKFEAQQRAKESRKKATNITVKEMKYRPKIGGGDFDTKTRKVAQFLGEGHKVKVTIMFRGREMQHPELGRRILDRVAEDVNEVGRVEIMPKQDGRNMTMVLGPDKKAQAAAQKRAATEAAEALTHDGDTEPSSNDETEAETQIDATVIDEAVIADVVIADVEIDAAVIAEVIAEAEETPEAAEA